MSLSTPALVLVASSIALGTASCRRAHEPASRSVVRSASESKPTTTPRDGAPPPPAAQTTAPASNVSPTPGGHAVASPPAPPAPFALPGAPPPPSDIVEALRKALTSTDAAEAPRTRHRTPEGGPRYVNRLLLEQSPYLRQHAFNPVDWHPWGRAAFEEAQRLGRPVLLSIGYSTCHWCHVMEEESFEDVEIATYINAHYVPIKVDREERPDVDETYMHFVQMLTGRGGWPMTVWLTPQGEPFFGGTYFPPRDGARGHAKGFLTILREMYEEYERDPQGVGARATHYAEALRRADAQWLRRGGMPPRSVLRETVDRFWSSFDAEFGGFGRGAKFPRPAALDFLLRVARHTRDARAVRMVRQTLEAMRKGGIHDHVAGGFHRYTVDRRWSVPHFEKMLYDNAQLARVYLEASRALAVPDWELVCRETLDYLLREMRSPEGAFYSATDADSPEGEGAFATWTPAQVEAAAGPKLAPLLVRYFGVTPAGNFEGGATVLHIAAPLESVAKELGMDRKAAHDALALGKARLYEARLKRPQPLLDDKVITGWNALAISAFARAAFVLNESRYREAAVRAAAFLLERLRRPDGRLWRRWRAGEARFDAVLDDYALAVEALLDLFEADPDPRWLRAAIELQAVVDQSFRAPGGAYHLTAADAERLVARPVPSWDGAMPSGNAVTAMNLIRLAAITGKEAYRQRFEALAGAFGQALRRGGTGMPAMLAAVEASYDRFLEIVIVTPPGQRDDALVEVLRRRYLPNRTVVRLDDTDEDRDHLAPFTPLVAERHARDGKPTAYVCEHGTCQRPATDPAAFGAQLDRVSPL